MALNAGQLTRRIQIRRSTDTRDQYGNLSKVWGDHGSPIFARRRDISYMERMAAGKWDNKLVTRFIIRSTSFGRGIKRTDRIVHEGIPYEIDGIKEVPGSRAFIEITAMTDEIE